MCGDRGFRLLRHCSRHPHVDRIQHPHSRVLQDLQAVSFFSLIQSLISFLFIKPTCPSLWFLTMFVFLSDFDFSAFGDWCMLVVVLVMRDCGVVIELKKKRKRGVVGWFNRVSNSRFNMCLHLIHVDILVEIMFFVWRICLDSLQSVFLCKSNYL